MAGSVMIDKAVKYKGHRYGPITRALLGDLVDAARGVIPESQRHTMSSGDWVKWMNSPKGTGVAFRLLSERHGSPELDEAGQSYVVEQCSANYLDALVEVYASELDSGDDSGSDPAPSRS